jgi:ESCRT-II complex subunit VPS22
VGVDPLASNKGFWSDVLGLGDFYFELGIKIIRITVRTRSSNGGIMLLSELVQELQKANVSADERASAEDVIRSIEKLSVLGCGFKLTKGKNPLVVSVPLEVSVDHEYILSSAQDAAGTFTESQVRGEYGWSKVNKSNSFSAFSCFCLLALFSVSSPCRSTHSPPPNCLLSLSPHYSRSASI